MINNLLHYFWPKPVATAIEVRLPSDFTYDQAAHNRWDTFYNIPPAVESFLEHANREAREGFRILPWTLNRATSLFYKGEYVSSFYYGDIEQDVVGVLDALQVVMTNYESRIAGGAE